MSQIYMIQKEWGTATLDQIPAQIWKQNLLLHAHDHVYIAYISGRWYICFYCIRVATSRESSADDTTATAEAGAEAAPATGPGAGADAGATNSCADAEATRTAMAKSSTEATRGAIRALTRILDSNVDGYWRARSLRFAKLWRRRGVCLC